MHPQGTFLNIFSNCSPIPWNVNTTHVLHTCLGAVHICVLYKESKVFSPLLLEDQFVPLESSSVSLGSRVSAGGRCSRTVWTGLGGCNAGAPPALLSMLGPRSCPDVGSCMALLAHLGMGPLPPLPHRSSPIPCHLCQIHKWFQESSSHRRVPASLPGGRSLPITPNPIYSHFQTCSELALLISTVFFGRCFQRNL